MRSHKLHLSTTSSLISTVLVGVCPGLKMSADRSCLFTQVCVLNCSARRTDNLRGLAESSFHKLLSVASISRQPENKR